MVRMVKLEIPLQIPDNVDMESFVRALNEYCQKTEFFRSFEKFYDIDHWKQRAMFVNTFARAACIDPINCEPHGRIDCIEYYNPSGKPNCGNDVNMVVTVDALDNSEIVECHQYGRDAFLPRLIGHGIVHKTELKITNVVDRIVALDYVMNARGGD